MSWFKIFTPQKTLFFRTLGSIFRILTFQIIIHGVSISFFRLSFSLLMIVFIGTPLLAKKVQPEKLSDYLLTSKQLRALKPAEQVHYIAFLYHFTAAIEMLENSPKTSEYAHNSSSSHLNSYVYLSQLLTPKAQADDESLMLLGKGLPQEPLIPIGRGLPNSGKNFSTAGADMYRHIKPCADQFNPAYMNKVTDKGLQITSIPCPKPGLQSDQIVKKRDDGSESPTKNNIVMQNMEFNRFKPQGKQNSQQSAEKKAKPSKTINEPPCAPKGVQPYNTTTLPDGTWGSYGPPCSTGSASSIAKNTNDSNPEGVMRSIDAGDPNKGGVSPKTPSVFDGLHKDSFDINYRKKGNKCIFGMWVSEFNRMPNNTIKCTRPKGSDCRQANGQSGFRCNTFGFSRNKQKSEVSQLTCISLYSADKGLDDLTERCVAANKKLIASVAVDSQQYDSFIKKMKEDLDQFEDLWSQSKDENSKITFRVYCSNQLSTNVNIQKPECTALLGLIDELRRKIKLPLAEPTPKKEGPIQDENKKDGTA